MIDRSKTEIYIYIFFKTGEISRVRLRQGAIFFCQVFGLVTSCMMAEDAICYVSRKVVEKLHAATFQAFVPYLSGILAFTRFSSSGRILLLSTNCCLHCIRCSKANGHPDSEWRCEADVKKAFFIIRRNYWWVISSSSDACFWLASTMTSSTCGQASFPQET